MQEKRLGTQAAGALGLVVIMVVVAVLLGMYQKVFTDTVRVTVMSDRAGLQLDKGARVRAFGVPVGEVRGVEVKGDRVAIDVALDTDTAGLIPKDVTASIRATTVFGAKFVNLDVSQGVVTSPITADTVIASDSTTIEANDVFQNAMSLLDAVDPEKLNSTLTAMSTALDGRGERLGELLTSTDGYLKAINPSLDELQNDFDLTADVARNFDAVAPQAIDVATNLTTTARTLDSVQSDLDKLLKGVVPAADSVVALVDSFDVPLTAATETLLPVSQLLNRYEPGLPCVLDLLAAHTKRIKLVVGNYQPVISMSVGFLPGQDPYTAAENLPKLVTGVGPKCYAQGSLEKPGFKRIRFDDGTINSYDDTSEAVDLGAKPITIYSDLVRQFLGEAGLESVLGALTPDTTGTTSGTEGTP